MNLRMTWTRLITLIISVLSLALGWQARHSPFIALAQPSLRVAEIQAPTNARRLAPQGISDIHTFLEQCPTADPIYTQLRNDIKLRRNEVLVGDIPCTAPISQLPLAQYTDELIYMQTVRTIYYLDLGRSGHLPWTPGTLYAWMTSKIKGINLSDTASTSYCCATLDGETYIVIKTQNDSNRDYDRQWKGISGNLALIMHEVRHTDGFPHDSNCGIPNGCDPTYDEGNLSPYGIQWWLEKSWLNRDLDMGLSCANRAEMQDILNYHCLNANNQFRLRFSSNPPPVLNMPPISCPVNLTQSTWQANRTTLTAFESVIFTTEIQNLGDLANGTVLTVTLPSQTTFSFAYASQGTVSGTGPVIFDLGAVDYGDFPITASFEVMVNAGVTDPTALMGQSTLGWSGGNNPAINYVVIANADLLYLPLVAR